MNPYPFLLTLMIRPITLVSSISLFLFFIHIHERSGDTPVSYLQPKWFGSIGAYPLSSNETLSSIVAGIVRVRGRSIS